MAEDPTPRLVELTDFTSTPQWLRDRTLSAAVLYAPIHPGAKQDEKGLWAAIQFPGITPREAGAFLGIPPRRVRYLCEKWSRRRFYESGVSVDLGWPVRG